MRNEPVRRRTAATRIFRCSCVSHHRVCVSTPVAVFHEPNRNQAVNPKTTELLRHGSIGQERLGTLRATVDFRAEGERVRQHVLGIGTSRAQSAEGKQRHYLACSKQMRKKQQVLLLSAPSIARHLDPGNCSRVHAQQLAWNTFRGETESRYMHLFSQYVCLPFSAEHPLL